MLYEKHSIMRVTIICMSPPADPSRMESGMTVEDDARGFWWASTNPIKVSAAVRGYVSVTRGLTIDFKDRDRYPEQSTRFTVEYDKSLWSSDDVLNALLAVVAEVNVKPQPRQLTKSAEQV